LKASRAIENAAGKFDTAAQAILTRCEQSGLQLRVEGEHLKVKGSRAIIAAWQSMIQRHKPEIIALLSGQNSSQIPDEDCAMLAADYNELTACIIELCQLAGYPSDVQERMLTARQNLYPYMFATECAYFRLQVIRARARLYWHGDALQAGM